MDPIVHASDICKVMLCLFYEPRFIESEISAKRYQLLKSVFIYLGEVIKKDDTHFSIMDRQQPLTQPVHNILEVNRDIANIEREIYDRTNRAKYGAQSLYGALAEGPRRTVTTVQTDSLTATITDEPEKTADIKDLIKRRDMLMEVFEREVKTYLGKKIE